MSTSYVGDINHPTQLKEVTVTPAEWQKDFHKNFGDAEVRRRIINSLPRDMVERPYKQELQSIRKTYSEIRDKYKKGNFPKKTMIMLGVSILLREYRCRVILIKHFQMT